jgi:3-demethoxyubiquinol 3-hydroxylase
MKIKTLGDLTENQEIERAIRVDHAGEYGAQMIYSGQMAVFKNKKDQETLELIQHMKIQEDAHFNYFNSELVNKKIRPTLMQPVWQICGFALGAATALMGKKAAMACTVAVEEVIDEHYQDQLKNLQNCDSLKEKIEQFRKEELEHRDIGLENEAEKLALYKPLTFFVKKASKLAIFISSRI